MTLAIIGKFYDKFLSLKNEPQINRKTFFIRILVIGFLCSCSWGLLNFMVSDILMIRRYTSLSGPWSLIEGLFPVLFSYLLWVYIMNITIVKRVSDI